MEIFITEGGGMGFHKRRNREVQVFKRLPVNSSTRGVWHINNEG